MTRGTHMHIAVKRILRGIRDLQIFWQTFSGIFWRPLLAPTPVWLYTFIRNGPTYTTLRSIVWHYFRFSPKLDENYLDFHTKHLNTILGRRKKLAAKTLAAPHKSSCKVLAGPPVAEKLKIQKHHLEQSTLTTFVTNTISTKFQSRIFKNEKVVKMPPKRYFIYDPLRGGGLETNARIECLVVKSTNKN